MDSQLNWNKTPIALFGMKAVGYKDPEERAAWALPVCDAFYIGRAAYHYYMKSSG